MMSKFRKWHLREPKFAKFPGGACPRTPLEARAFGANNYSLFSITWGWNLCESSRLAFNENPEYGPQSRTNSASVDGDQTLSFNLTTGYPSLLRSRY